MFTRITSLTTGPPLSPWHVSERLPVALSSSPTVHTISSAKVRAVEFKFPLMISTATRQLRKISVGVDCWHISIYSTMIMKFTSYEIASYGIFLMKSYYSRSFSFITPNFSLLLSFILYPGSLIFRVSLCPNPEAISSGKSSSFSPIRNEPNASKTTFESPDTLAKIDLSRFYIYKNSVPLWGHVILKIRFF